jgi:hypothetical protein
VHSSCTCVCCCDITSRPASCWVKGLGGSGVLGATVLQHAKAEVLSIQAAACRGALFPACRSLVWVIWLLQGARKQLCGKELL